ncbi:hypothetical protein EZS27_006910 [termite gut metagenome]|uniref:Uncharacterized protein n=1 Tax=termite gut metagenome TaxID=433724 RepID=A0A5J4SID3_9ZZZZ
MITTFPLGFYRGRIENMVGYVRCGRQVFRSINDRPFNPKTDAQMRQRTKLSNILSAYRTLSSFVRESYQTRPPSLTAYNMFVKNNLRATDVFLDKREALAKACVVAEFNVSEGSLPTIETKVSGDRLVTSLRLPMGFSIDETTTLGEVSSRLVGCNASLCYGDKISVLYMIQVRPNEEFGSCMPHAQFKLYEFVLEGDSRIPFYTLMDERLFRSVDGHVGTDAQVGEGAVGYAHSRRTKRCTEYSTQSLALLPDTVLCRAYGSLRKSDKASASYGKKVESGKLKVESEELKKDKVTVSKVVPVVCPNETRVASGTAGGGIAKELLKAGRVRKLKGKKKKGKKKTKGYQKVDGLKVQRTLASTKRNGSQGKRTNHPPAG